MEFWDVNIYHSYFNFIKRLQHKKFLIDLWSFLYWNTFLYTVSVYLQTYTHTFCKLLLYYKYTHFYAFIFFYTSFYKLIFSLLLTYFSNILFEKIQKFRVILDKKLISYLFFFFVCTNLIAILFVLDDRLISLFSLICVIKFHITLIILYFVYKLR